MSAISFEAFVAKTLEETVGVDTRGVSMAVVDFFYTFIYVAAIHSISTET